jgi:hypothetical protein
MNQSTLFKLERLLYRLQGREAVRCTLKQWGTMMAEEDRKVGDEMVGDTHISTVFLGVDHGHNGGKPTLFETMVFEPGGDSVRCHRCSTWDDAEKMHQTMVELIREEQSQDGMD